MTKGGLTKAAFDGTMQQLLEEIKKINKKFKDVADGDAGDDERKKEFSYYFHNTLAINNKRQC